jgi:hypothetical protein
MELTKREKQLASRCVSWSNSFLIKKVAPLSLVGAVLFGLDVLPIFPLPEWLKTTFFTLGLVMILNGVFSDFVKIIAKLYVDSKEAK